MDNNKQKALKISGLCKVCLKDGDGKPTDGCSECEKRGAYYGALKMAEYKDKQFASQKREWIDKVWKWIASNGNGSIHTQDEFRQSLEKML